MELKNHIEKLPNGKYRLLSHDGKNLGTFDSHEAAAKHEGEVEYFKSKENGTRLEDTQPQIENARGFPKIFYCKHMESGLCGYENENILVDEATMKKMAASFAGKPIYVQHQDVDLKKIQEQADGFVADCFYNDVDGWLWSKMIIVSDKGNDAVNKGWSVSNAYIPTEWGSGGSHHNVDYNRKIVNAEFTHLAIVPDPRYESAKIFTPDEYKNYCLTKRQEIDELRNSKRKKPMLKFWKTEKKEVAAADIDADTIVELQNGKTITVREMDEALAAAEVDPLAEKVAKFEALENAKMKKNADDKGVKDEKEIEKDGEEKFNAEDEEELERLKEKKNKWEKRNNPEGGNAEKEKKNAEKEAGEKEMKEMKNARDKAAYTGSVQHIDLDVDQLARGKSRYGSTKKEA